MDFRIFRNQLQGSKLIGFKISLYHHLGVKRFIPSHSSTNFEEEGLWNKMNQMVTQNLQQQLALEANRQITKWKTEDNLENGEEYVEISKNPYRNLMLDKWVLRIKKKPTKHILFLPQEVVKVKYGSMVFKEITISNNNLHKNICNQILTQMNGCNIFLDHNIGIKTEQGLL